jgi:hypothetical protein
MEKAKKETKAKPLSMAVAEFREKLARDVNTSGLPPCILEMAVGGIWKELAGIAAAQETKDAEAYREEEKENGNLQDA